MNEALESALCEMRAQLFVQSMKRGFAGKAFVKAFMNSDVPVHPDPTSLLSGDCQLPAP